MSPRCTKIISLFLIAPILSACGDECSKYSSRYSCDYIEKRAEYFVWYWRALERNDEKDNVMIGKAVGLEMCEYNARRYAAIIGEQFRYRAYICGLIEDGKLMEKHRLLSK